MMLRENALFKTRLLSDKLDQVIRFGYVTTRQPEKMRVRVELRDTPTSPMVTYWLPVLCPRACGDLVYDLPDIGDQVLCVFLPTGLEAGFVLGAMYGKASPPVTSGDKYHRRFRDGTTIEYDRSTHALTVNVQGTACVTTTGAVTLKAGGTVTAETPTFIVKGNLLVQNGSISVPGGDVSAGAVSLSGHRHIDTQPGEGQSGTPYWSGTIPASQDDTPEVSFAKAEQNIITASGGMLSDVDRTILCLPDIAAAVSERQSNAADKQGWIYLHEMFLKWIAGEANDKADNCDEPFWIEWNWAMSYEQDRAAYQEFIGQGDGTILSGKAKDQLGQILSREDVKKEVIEAGGMFDFTGAEYKHWKALYHTLIKVDFGATESYPINGIIAALSSHTLRALAKGKVEYRDDGSMNVVVKQIGVFVHDLFNFEGDAPLGSWDCENKQGPDGLRGILLENEDFRDFRGKSGYGGDFLVLSEPHIVESFTECSYVWPCAQED